MIGILGRVGKRNWDFLTKIGTRQGGSEGCFSFNQLVVTPLFILPVGVLYSTTTAVIWTEDEWSWNGKYKFRDSLLMKKILSFLKSVKRKIPLETKISSNIYTVTVAKSHTNDLMVASSWKYPPKCAQCCDSLELSIVDRPLCLPRWSTPSILTSPFPQGHSHTLLTPWECACAGYL